MLPEDLDFRVTEGLRTLERQRQLKRQGASRTLNSRHITGHAVDVFVLLKGVGTWDFKQYKRLAAVIKQAAKLEKVPIVWGGDWVSFRDGPHFELQRKVYP
jgi:peptidoglycan L-alanyl-D-glutamate endopeptidase CwlK